MKASEKTVFVGLSGGVDSSVAAWRLIEQGYRVVGAYMKNWTRDIAGNECPWEDDLRSAKSVAAHLGIELRVFDLQDEYKARVVDVMVEAYRSGLTPNPDVLCNEEIKFSLFFKLCLDAGADYVATGHYARLGNGRLAMAIDTSKDQTYFLYRLPPEHASQVLFPLGDLRKTEVRELATAAGLPTARRPESMGLCFVGKVPLKDFLAEFTQLTPGDILAEDGTVLGRHDGALLYTIGQRHGLGVGGGTPYYVFSKDLVRNTVTVTTDPSQLRRSSYTIGNCVWWQQPELEKTYQVRIRHLGELLLCRLESQPDGVWRVVLIGDAHRGVAAGQHAVIYENDVVVGGGQLQ